MIDRDKSAHPLNLRDIAAWQFPNLVGRDKTRLPILAGLPSLQRGAVWKQDQVELLWDSILRGFPIGSLVVSDKLERQNTRPGKFSKEGWADNDWTHHLLDGQQRCNGIALGFYDPFNDDIACEPEKTRAILWIDLSSVELTNGGTGSRSFLLRLTTLAHPWGFMKSDEANRLGVGDIRVALDKYGRGNTKPTPEQAWPYKAEAPIPLSWLLLSYAPSDDCETFWEKVLNRLNRQEEKLNNLSWINRAKQLLEAGNSSIFLKKIHLGLRRSAGLTVIALQIPEEALREASLQEVGGAIDSVDKAITNVEHLFERLNRKGTQLSTLELAYSMIKAYWPDVEGAIRDLGKQLMPEAHLASLTARLALSKKIGNGKYRLENPISISRLRRIAIEGEKYKEEKEQIKEAFDLEYLQNILKVIDHWLLCRGEGDYGLPEVLRTSIAVNTPDVFLLLMVLARHILEDNDHNLYAAKSAAEPMRREILAMATVLRWFCVDTGKAVRRIVESDTLSSNLRPRSFFGILAPSTEEGEVLHILQPKDLQKIMVIEDVEDPEHLKNWKWADRYITLGRDSENDLTEEQKKAKRQDRENTLLPFLNRLLNSDDSRQLLLYAQRFYICRQFPGYDPADPDQWEQHNRPWDYDHILPSAIFYYNPAKYRNACWQWSGTIGNLRAWPLEKNRSKSDEQADKTGVGA